MSDEVAGLIELQHRRRRRAALRDWRIRGGVQFTRFERSGAMNDPDMVLRVHRNADGLAHDPVVGQRLRPQRVDFEARGLNVGGLHYGLFL